MLAGNEGFRANGRSQNERACWSRNHLDNPQTAGAEISVPTLVQQHHISDRARTDLEGQILCVGDRQLMSAMCHSSKRCYKRLEHFLRHTPEAKGYKLRLQRATHQDETRPWAHPSLDTLHVHAACQTLYRTALQPVAGSGVHRRSADVF